jgi:hypothetical protein
MLQSVIQLALSSARVLPAIDMLRDFSETAQLEARAGAEALMGLGLCLGAGAGLLFGGATLAALAHPFAAGGFLIASLPCAYMATRFKKVLDDKLAKLEQLKGAALATRAAKSIASKTMEMGMAAYGSVASGGRAAAEAASHAGSAARALPGHAATSASSAMAPIGKAASSKANAAFDVVAAASAALADPATRQAASQLAGEAMHGLARGAGMAAGWIKSRKSSTAPSLPDPAALSAPDHSTTDMPHKGDSTTP